MLRNVRLKNFVHFKDETIAIQEDSNAVFFMGENNSGKSCVFEAIRRCMSTSKSLGMSTPHKPNEIMFVSCHFENNVKHVYSLVIRPHDKPNQTSCDEHVIKIVYVDYKEKPDTLFAVDIVKRIKAHKIANQALSETLISLLKQQYIDKKLDDFILVSEKLTSQEKQQYIYKTMDDFVLALLENKNLLDEIQQFAKSENNAPEYSEDTNCERFLKEHVDGTTVITFPMRSISPYQWTESERLQHSQTPEIVKEISQKAEILSWYLSNNDSITDIEKERETRYFNTLTNMCEFEFQIDKENKITALNGNFKDGEKKPIAILKVPEGIYEAKKVSIILALDRFETVCFEDPDRGMHTQMVERFRDLVLHGIKDKTVVVTSHQPSFLSPWTIPHTFHFRRHTQQHEQTFNVVAMRSISTDGPPGGEKTARIISSNDLPTIFLARRVIFVEGDDDFLFMTALQQILLSSDIAEKCAEKCETTTDKLRSSLCPLHVVAMRGEANKLKFRYVCNKLGILHLFLIDNDALYKNIKTPDIYKPTQKSAYDIFPFLYAFDIAKSENEEICEHAEGDVSALEESGFFVWKKTLQCTGTINSVVIRFCITENLIECMKENNVNPFIKWTLNRKLSDVPLTKSEADAKIAEYMDKKIKLFNDQNVSSQNITNAVTKLIETSLVSRDTDNEILRFLKFLSKAYD